MYYIKIKTPTKQVFLKENYGEYYLYTHNIKKAKQFSYLEYAKECKSFLNLEILETSEILSEEELYETKYFVNPITHKVEKIKLLVTDNNTNLFDTIEEALIHIDVMKDGFDTYDQLSYSNPSYGDAGESPGGTAGDSSGYSSSGGPIEPPIPTP